MSFLAYPATDEQKRLVALAGELADTFAKRAASGDWDGRFPLENYEDLRQAGYLTLTVPREFGGQEASLLDVTLAQLRLAQGDASTALAVGMHLTTIARLAEGLVGPNQMFSHICHAVVQDGAMINSAASEPATGSPSRGGRPTTLARRQSDGSWSITGRKTFTTGSLALQLFIVSCSIEDETGSFTKEHADRGNFLIPHTAPGLHIEQTWNSLGMRGSGSNDLILENVHVGPEAYITGQLLTNVSGAWSLPVAAVYLGIAQAARNEAVHFAQRRRPNSLTQSITSIPHIQEKAAKIELALLQCRAVLFGIAEQFCNDPSSVTASQFAATKYLLTNHAVEIVDLAMRLVGGASLSLTTPLQRYYRDVRAGLHHPPMDDTTMTLLAREALDRVDEQKG